MPSLHWASHAMAVGIIAWLLRQHLQLRYHCQHLPHPSCSSSPPAQPSPDEQGSAVTTPTHPSPPKELSTSITCWDQNRTSRTCRFRDLCYSTATHDFVIFHGNESYFENVPWSELPGWLDLTSVADHNTCLFQPIDLPGKSIDRFHPHWIRRPSLIMMRFKPDNVMHVLHDDILPAHHTLQTMFTRGGGSLAYDAALVLVDDWEDELEFDWLYQTLSETDVITRRSLAKQGEMVCFSDAVVGVSKSTTWYQYGFSSPQSPLLDLSVTASDVHAAAKFMLNRMSYPCCDCEEKGYIVLLSRQHTRLILNEADLVWGVVHKTGLRVVPLSLETDSLASIQQTVHCSRGAVGMHGSLLIVAMFLRPGSFLVELFPYAVPPENYTPYKTLANIPGMNITYRTWANPGATKSIAHPDWPEDLGGIEHLTLEEQETIKSQTSVPEHMCCKDPSWLYHAYQDTIVDVSAVSGLVQEALQTADALRSSSFRPPPLVPLPGRVGNLACQPAVGNSAKAKLHISWSVPWNLQFLQYSQCQFELWLQDVNSEEVLSIIVPACIHTHVDLDQVQSGHKYHVWVRAVLGGNVTGAFQGVFDCSV